MLISAVLGALMLHAGASAPSEGPVVIPSVRPGDDLGAIVARLADADPEARRLAQRDLAGALTGVDGALALGEALLDAPAEAQRRVARVLGREPRLLGLAAELAGATTGAPARVGREALLAQLERWSPSAFDEPEVAAFDPPRQDPDMQRLPRTWVEGVSLRLALDPVAGGLVGAFDRLDRWGGGPAPIVLDPRVVTRAVRRPIPPIESTRLQGSWSQVLNDLCRVHGVAYQLQGYRYPGERRPGEDTSGDEDTPPPRAFIHVVPAGTTQLAPVGVDLRALASDEIVRWCRDLARDGDIVRQRAAARALAALDWPAAVQWLEVRWLERGDVAALEGLLAAAARGRVAPSLQRPDVVRRAIAIVDADGQEVQDLYAVRDAAIAEANRRPAEQELRVRTRAVDARAQRFAVGLARIAPVVVNADAGGRSLAATVLEGFDAAPPTGRWLRLAVLEGLGLESPAAARAARRVVTGELEARSRRQALRTLLVVGAPGETVTIDRVAALFDESSRGSFGLGLELGLAGAVPRDGAFVGTLSRDDQALAELLVWAALLEEGRQGAALPPWMIATARAVAGLSSARRTRSSIDPLRRAAFEARGDLPRALGELAERMGRGLSGRSLRSFEAAVLSAGLAGPELRARAFASAIAELQGASNREPDPVATEAAWAALASLVGDTRHGEASLALLQEALVAALLDGQTREALGSSTALARAAEAAADGLRRARKDVAVEDFVEALQRAASTGRHPLRNRFYSEIDGHDWPPPSVLPARDLERLEPLLPRR